MRKFRTMRGGGFRSAYSTVAVVIIAAFSMALMSSVADADDTSCTEEGSTTSPDVDGNSVYHLLADCTLHIGRGTITQDSGTPITQGSKVRSIIIDDPSATRFDDDASNMFASYYNVESISGLERMDTSNVTRFKRMFAGLRNLKAPIDLSYWDMSKAVDLSGMFSGANLDMFKGYGRFRLDGSPLDLSSMFSSSTTSGSIDLSEWHIGDSVTISTMSSMFSSATAPGGINIKGDVAKNGALLNVGMFAGVKTSIEGIDGLNMSRSTSAESMFSSANLTGSMDLSSWDMSSVVNAKWMFTQFSPSNNLDLSSWNMSSVKNTSGMFQQADIDKLQGIDKWDLSNVEDASSMYAQIHPTSPMRIPEDMDSVTNATFMFEGSDLDNVTNLSNLRLHDIRTAIWMFRNAKRNYLDMSRWRFHATDYSNILGMLGSPDIKYIKFGDTFKYSRKNLNNELFYGGNSMRPENIWDRLPSYNATNRWSRLPYNDKDGKFDGTLESLGSGSGWIDQSMWWESPHTGEDADNDLKNIAGDPGSIIFREVTRPVRFHGNTTGTVTGMPSMTASTWASTIDGDRVPCNAVPADSTGGSRFMGWNTKPDGKGTAYQPCDQLDHGVEAMDLYAQWKELKKVPVRFHDTSGQATGMPTDAEQHQGDSYTIPGQMPKRPGYRFKGWATTETGKPVYQPGSVIDIGDDVEAIDLYPVWEQTGISMLPAAGLPAKALLGTIAGTLLLIPLSAAIIGRRRRL